MEYELSELSERIRNTARLLEPLSRKDTLRDGKAGSCPIFWAGSLLSYLPMTPVD